MQPSSLTNERWTRIILDDSQHPASHKFPVIKTDMENFKSLERDNLRLNHRIWKPIFDPEQYTAENESLLLSEYGKSPDELLELGTLITRLREQLRVKVMESVNERREQGLEAEADIAQIAKKIEKGYHRTRQ